MMLMGFGIGVSSCSVNGTTFTKRRFDGETFTVSEWQLFKWERILFDYAVDRK